jgi:hypothetical protein
MPGFDRSAPRKKSISRRVSPRPNKKRSRTVRDLVVTTRHPHPLARVVIMGVFTLPASAGVSSVSWLAPLMLSCDRLMEECEVELPKYPDGEAWIAAAATCSRRSGRPAAIELRDIVGVENLGNAGQRLPAHERPSILTDSAVAARRQCRTKRQR